MFRNVLVGVDGRPNGCDAIALASRLADTDGTITLAHVHAGELRPSRAISPGLVREEREASRKLLEDARSVAGIDAEPISITAVSPGRGLHEQAECRGADLLVVGSCSHGAFGRAMLGDDTRGALNGAPCAVAVASLGYAANSAPIANIGVGYNGSPESKAALAIAQQFAATTGASVHAREIVSIPTVAYTGTSSSSAHAATVPSSAWFSAAPRTTSSATRAARCWCSPACSSVTRSARASVTLRQSA